MFPILEGFDITHHWGGLLGATVDWHPYVHFDRLTGFGAAGGYAGRGVGASNLAGRIMADLVLERDTDISHLPWVDVRPEKWPIEPLRWLGATSLIYLAKHADRSEMVRGKRSTFWGLLYKQMANRIL